MSGIIAERQRNEKCGSLDSRCAGLMTSGRWGSGSASSCRISGGIGSHGLIVRGVVVDTVVASTMAIILHSDWRVVPERCQHFFSCQEIMNDSLSHIEAQGSRINIAMTPEQQSTEAWFGKDVENTIEDSFGVRRDDVATLAESPGNRIKEPQEHGPAAAEQIDLASAERHCVLAANMENVESNEY